MTGQELKQWRKERGLTQAKFAERFPVNIWTLRNWEQSRFGIPEYLFRALRDFDREFQERPASHGDEDYVDYEDNPPPAG